MMQSIITFFPSKYWVGIDIAQYFKICICDLIDVTAKALSLLY